MIEWLGWGEYSNTGRTYRWWRFKVAVPALKALPGDTLQDRGPGMEERSRFVVHRNGQRINSVTVAQTEALLGGPVPSWAPPVIADPDLLQAQRDTIRLFGLLADAIRLLVPKPKPEPKPTQPEQKNRARGVYGPEKRGGDLVYYAVNSQGEKVAERQVDPWHSTPAEEACLCSELQDLLNRMDPQPEPIPDEEAVAALLANLDADGPEETYAARLLQGRAETRYYMARAKLRQRRDREIRERGKDCSECGQHFKPRTVKQLRCPACIQARKRGGAA